jgi:hypothetical protein
LLNPNNTLNQHLQKPSKPIKFTAKIKITVSSCEISNKKQYKFISTKNFKVPGIPEKKIIIKKITMLSLGVSCASPKTVTIDLE